MPIQTSWLFEPYILQSTCTQPVSSHELQTLLVSYLERLQTGSLYLLLDLTDLSIAPRKLLEMPTMLQVVGHANLQWFAIVDPNSSQSTTTRLLAGDKVKLFTDEKKAASFLQGMVRIDTGLTS